MPISQHATISSVCKRNDLPQDVISRAFSSHHNTSISTGRQDWPKSKLLPPVMAPEKDPANISYMCLQMKRKMANSHRLLTQKQKVRNLSQKLNAYKK